MVYISFVSNSQTIEYVFMFSLSAIFLFDFNS